VPAAKRPTWHGRPVEAELGHHLNIIPFSLGVRAGAGLRLLRPELSSFALHYPLPRDLSDKRGL